MITTWVIIFLISVLIYYIISFHIKNRKYFRNLPGPKPNIFFGNTLDFAFRPTYELLDVFMGYKEKYGSIFLIHDGPLSRGLILSDADFLEQILSSPKFINKGGPYEYLYGWLGTGLLTSVGSKWKKRRRMLTPSFHFSILDNFVDIFHSVGDIFIEKLEKEIGKNVVNIHPLVSLMTLDVICEAAMGIKINAQHDSTSEYVRKVKVMCSIFIDRMRSPIHPLFYRLTYNHFREKMALKVIHAHTDGVIDKRIETMSKIGNEDEQNHVGNGVGEKKKLAFLDLLLKSTIDGKPLSKMDIREEVDTFMFEGHDTTSAAISFTLYSMAMNSEVQEKVFLEQKEIFDNLKDVKATIQQLQEMKYLELVIKEALRLYPSVPFVGRTLLEDFKFGGNIYPKGLNLMIMIYAVQRDPKLFPEPLKFDPERFRNNSRINPYVYIPFSAGPRNCIGQKFAMLELKTILSKVVRNFVLLPTEPFIPLQLAPETILNSTNGINISLRRRK